MRQKHVAILEARLGCADAITPKRKAAPEVARFASLFWVAALGSAEPVPRFIANNVPVPAARVGFAAP